MLSAPRLLAVLVGVAAAAPALTSSPSNVFNPRVVVLGRDGQVLDHVDPTPFLYTRMTQRSTLPSPTKRGTVAPRVEHSDAENDVASVLPTHENSVMSSKLSIVQLSDDLAERDSIRGAENAHVVELEPIEVVFVSPPPSTHVGVDGEASAPGRDRELDTHHEIYRAIQQETEHDEFLQLQSPLLAVEGDQQRAVEVPEVMSERAALFGTSLPGVPGSILFSEMSCLFVAFIGYLVHSIPLWSRFSRGQRWCLLVAFSAAVLYQIAAVSWYFELVSPEVMIGLSSLITRMISLGMVPITTTSFVGRAREACSEQQQQQHVALLSSGRNARHRHPRARAS